MNRTLSIALFTLLAACTPGAANDGGTGVADPRSDAGGAGPTDASHEADGPISQPGADAGADASPDAAPTDAASGSDASGDAGPSSDAAVEGGMDASSQKVPVLAVAKITGATGAEIVMIGDGVALANATMKTPCFKSFVLSAKWTETNGLSQSQIYDKLCAATMTVDVDMYTGSWTENHVTHTVGYEKEPGLVHMNRYFVDTAYMVADNLIHEAEGHSQGFSHYGVKATSVPYGLNAAFEACSPVGP